MLRRQEHQAANENSANVNYEDESDLKRTLDALDEIRFEVNAVSEGDSSFSQEIMNYIPQVVVTGAQSAGKSAVLEQLSGVKLPQKAERCTRVAINIKMRRGPKEALRINLWGEHGVECTARDVSDTAKAIDELQQRALSMSGSNAEFATGYMIEVSVTGLKLANLTLVDLPGFTSFTERDTKLVLDIVTPYLDMDNTILLHVCKGDSDYGSVLGNDVLRPYLHKVIPVFTHMDRLESVKQQAIFNSILTATKAPRFVILGNYRGKPEGESAALKKLDAFTGYVDKFQYGRDALLHHLEAIQLSGLKKHLPTATKALTDMLSRVERRELEIAQRPTSEVICEATKLAGERFDAKLTENMTTLQRPLLREFVVNMQKLGLRAQGRRHLSSNGQDGSSGSSVASSSTDLECLRKLKTKEVLHVGDLVIHHSDSSATMTHTSSQPQRVTAVFGVLNDQTAKLFSRQLEYTYVLENKVEVDAKDLLVFESPRDQVIDRIKELASKNCGLQDMSDVQRHNVLNPIMGEFAVACGSVARAFLGKMAAVFHRYLADVVFDTTQVTDIAKPVLDELKCRMDAELDAIEAACAMWIDDAVGWSTAPLVFSINEFAFNALCAELEAEDDVQDGEHGVTYTKLRAYIKTHRNFVTEAVVRQIALAFNVKLKKKLEEVLGKHAGLDMFIQEPRGWPEERKLLGARKLTLRSALKKLSMPLKGNHQQQQQLD